LCGGKSPRRQRKITVEPAGAKYVCNIRKSTVRISLEVSVRIIETISHEALHAADGSRYLWR
jgi:hypothetical protein